MGLLVAIFAHAMLFVILLGIFRVLSALIWRVLRVRSRAGRLILILAPFGLAARPSPCPSPASSGAMSRRRRTCSSVFSIGKREMR